MTEFTQTYLGKSEDQLPLKQQLEQAQRQHGVLEVFLNPQDRGKARIYALSESGQSVGIIKDRHWSLREGDIFATISGKYLRIHLNPLEVMVLRCEANSATGDCGQALNVLEWFRLGHYLGNLHCPVTIEADHILVQFSGDRERLLSALSQFELPGLIVNVEQRSLAPMRPVALHSHSDATDFHHLE